MRLGMRVGVLGSVLLVGGWCSAPAQRVPTPPALIAQPARVPEPSRAQTAEFQRATSAARAILARDEFQEAQPTWWDRKLAQLRGLLARMFMTVDRLTTSAPWLGRLMEWLLSTAAAVGLLVWVLRTVQRQRVRMALGGNIAQDSTGSSRETEDWRRIAEEEAARGAWREAIHALYWASIVHLENRRAWRHNPARTPREYVRLLRPESAEQNELRTLTGALERSWYAQREPHAGEYAAARGSFERLVEISEPSTAPPLSGSVER